LGSLAVGLVLWPQLELPGRGALAWMLLVLVVPLAYGIESIYVAARWPTGLTALQVVTGEALVATLLLLPFLALQGEPIALDLTASTATLGILVFALAGVIEVLLYFYLIQQTGGVFVNFATFVALFAGIGWGMLLFGETHGVVVWLAVGMLLAALALVFWDGIRASRAAT
jgi:drug/metabolite transporter (DMT)-like permease